MEDKLQPGLFMSLSMFITHLFFDVIGCLNTTEHSNQNSLMPLESTQHIV